MVGGGKNCGNKVPFSSHVTSTPLSWFITAGSLPGFSSVKLLFLSYHPLWKEAHGILSRFHCPGSRTFPKLFEFLLGRFVFFPIYSLLHLRTLLVSVNSSIAILYLWLYYVVYFFSFAFKLCIGSSVSAIVGFVCLFAVQHFLPLWLYKMIQTRALQLLPSSKPWPHAQGTLLLSLRMNIEAKIWAWGITYF